VDIVAFVCEATGVAAGAAEPAHKILMPLSIAVLVGGKPAAAV
jgi:hypothetical protein